MKIKIFLKNILSKASDGFEKMQEKNVNPLTMLLVFLAVIGMRMFVEFFLIPRNFQAGDVLIEYLHNLLFFSITLILMWMLLSFFLKTNPKKLAFPMLLAIWIILMPPIADILWTKGDVYWSFYALTDFEAVYSQFVTFFGVLPSGIMYFGTRLGFILAVIFAAIVVFLKTKSLFKAFFGAFFTYIIVFLMGIFPSLATFVYYLFNGSIKLAEIKDFHAAQLFGGTTKIFGTELGRFQYLFAYNLDIVYFCLLFIILLGLFFWLSKSKFIAFIKNMRLPQVIYHLGLFTVGLGVGYLAYPENFNLNGFSILAVFCLYGAIFLAWEASVVVNDIFDYKIDTISNAERPLQKGIFEGDNYQNFGIILFILSLLGGIVVGVKFALILLVYQILAWFYSAEPFRLKKFPIIATFFSSCASLLMLFMGFVLFSGDKNLVGLSWRVISLMLIALTFSLPLKDFKDIDGDRADGIWTIPVIFGEKIAKLIIATGIFISFILSVFLLNEFRLFWWALLFGSMAFLLIVNKEIKNTKVFWWILGVLFFYLLIIMKIIFLK